ncbi:MAG: gfo/Idh/MocA family oxidoreductase [Acidobacteria bacterium]|nr:MAG: gfo/Idh/MocA family oxidoreductase [Acidobacteriota bacterium]
MRIVVIGLGVQGKKRKAVAADDLVACVDLALSGADYRSIEDVPLASFDAALVCTPDQAKFEILRYLLANRKHVLVEKPLLAESEKDLLDLDELARANHVTCYTAYNHRFEPHFVRLKETLSSGVLGKIYLIRVFYGNGTALDVKRSVWRDQGLGVLSDIGSHLIDTMLFWFGEIGSEFQVWSYDNFENAACDHVLFGSRGNPTIELEATLLAWRNTFTLDVFGDAGSAHINCLCKWGPSTFTLRKRVLPSGRPTEETETRECADPTWALEYEHFKDLCSAGTTNIQNDIIINRVMHQLAREVDRKFILK